MIEVAIKNKAFQDDIIIKDLTFSLKEKEILAIIGPSGTGKTTLLNLLSGLDKDFQGDIKTPQQKVAYMFQEPRLMPWLSVLENIRLVNKSEQGRARALQLLKMVGLEKYADAYPKQLSGGMQRRVALARAFLINPDIVLMDEPFVSLDLPSAEQLRAEFLKMWRDSSSSVVYVTHDLSEAISIADRILFLSKSPAKVVLEQFIGEKRPGSIYSDCVQNLQQGLLSQYPKLLEGQI